MSRHKGNTFTFINFKLKTMGRVKEFLINEQMRLTGNWREKDHYEYLAWRRQIEKEWYDRKQEKKKNTEKN